MSDAKTAFQACGLARITKSEKLNFFGRKTTKGKEKLPKPEDFGSFVGDWGTRCNQGVPAVQPAGSSTPPECCIQMGSSPLPHFHQKKIPSGWMGFLFGGDWGTRTLDLMRVNYTGRVSNRPVMCGFVLKYKHF